MTYREVKVAYCRKIYYFQQREIYGCKGSDLILTSIIILLFYTCLSENFLIFFSSCQITEELLFMNFFRANK